ncbi:hypothetical protein H2199_003230 [Coniosporium tulheliwenetii]|uniref:Uncharacterized protein n=1 Tax=Coniosporium tulheliwenetii TaxID=3383036 RepID=A0ACC2ZCC2_9PEZI|nr:hypothetical protein H2199_003230 [Cladosporium sp. JES 115]
MSEIASIAQVVAEGTRLSLDLHEFGALVPTATEDVNRIAKALSLLSLELRQAGETLRQDDSIASGEAVETIQDILQQCEAVYSDIEAEVPLKNVASGSDPRTYRPPGWSLVRRKTMESLLAQLESLRLTVSVMIHAFYTGRIIAGFRAQTALTPERARTAISNERRQLRTLVIEQQLALLHASKTSDEYRRSSEYTPDAPLGLLTQGGETRPGERAEEHPPTSLELVKYQEPSLADVKPSETETECLARILQVSKPYVDVLLAQWTRLSEIERRINQTRSGIEMSRQRELDDKRRSQQPYAESVFDDSDDELREKPGFRQKKRHSPGHRPNSPLSSAAFERPPLAVPRPKTPVSRSSAFPISPNQAFPASPPMSPSIPPPPTRPPYPISTQSNYAGNAQTSPRSSLSASLPTSPRSSFSANGSTVATSPSINVRQSNEELRGGKRGIGWRLLLHNSYWDFIDDKLVGNNPQLPSPQVYADRNTQTEIAKTWVSEEALREAQLPFTQIQKEYRDNGRTKFETCFFIKKAFKYPDIKRLVDRSTVISGQTRLSQQYQQQQQPQQQQQQYRPQHHQQLPQQRYAPPLDRSYTAPSAPPQYLSPISPRYPPAPAPPSLAPQPPPPPYQKSYSTRAASAAYYPDDSSSSSGDYSDSNNHRSSHHQSSSRKRRGSNSEGKKHMSGRAAVGTLAKVGGLAALLEGLSDIAI